MVVARKCKRTQKTKVSIRELTKTKRRIKSVVSVEREDMMVLIVGKGYVKTAMAGVMMQTNARQRNYLRGLTCDYMVPE